MESIRYTVGKVKTGREIDKPVTYNTTNVKALVKKAVNGDVEAFGEIYSIYLDRIYRYVFYQVHNKVTAEDLTEEVFIKAWSGIARYKWKGLPFSAWLYRIAHNHVVDYFRTSRQHQSLDEEFLEDGNRTEEMVEKKQILRTLTQALSALPVQQRHIITLKFIEGFDNRKIERITGKSQGAIRVMQMRALALLRHKLTDGMGQCIQN